MFKVTIGKMFKSQIKFMRNQDKNKQERSRIAESIRKQLIEIREAKGMSKAKFARATGVSRSTIIRIEQNETSPNMESLGTICEALDLDVRIIENK